MPQLNTPITFCIFNRPDVTARVFNEIARQRPKHLLVIGDGPRPDHPSDPVQIARARQILDRIDWPCDVRTCFANENMGCGKRMGTGLNWAFDQFEELIILEDDCLPHPSFFPYCEALLERFRNDPRVMMISGNHFQPTTRSHQSYYFSHWPHIWGWASWRDSWREFNTVQRPKSELEITTTLSKVFDHDDEVTRWTSIMRDFFEGKIDTWDFLWTYAIWSRQGLAVLPSQNLVSNLGFGQDATHTLNEASPLAALQTHDVGPLQHPKTIARDAVADRWTFENIMQLKGDAPPAKCLATASTKTRSWLRRLLRPKNKRKGQV